MILRGDDNFDLNDPRNLTGMIAVIDMEGTVMAVSIPSLPKKIVHGEYWSTNS